MYGKYLICLVTVSLIFVFTIGFSENKTLQKDKVYVNGYQFFIMDTTQIAGLRAKATADLFYRKKAYAKALKYYEEAGKLLPNEADIYFNIGNIYAHEEVYTLAATYYKKAMEKYLLPENYGKTQKFYFLSLVRYGFCLYKEKDREENKEKARAVVQELLDRESEIRTNFPDVVSEMEKLFKLMYGTTSVFRLNTSSTNSLTN